MSDETMRLRTINARLFAKLDQSTRKLGTLVTDPTAKREAEQFIKETVDVLEHAMIQDEGGTLKYITLDNPFMTKYRISTWKDIKWALFSIRGALLMLLGVFTLLGAAIAWLLS